MELNFENVGKVAAIVAGVIILDNILTRKSGGTWPGLAGIATSVVP